jgi:hypothetical protein
MIMFALCIVFSIGSYLFLRKRCFSHPVLFAWGVLLAPALLQILLQLFLQEQIEDPSARYRLQSYRLSDVCAFFTLGAFAVYAFLSLRGRHLRAWLGGGLVATIPFIAVLVAAQEVRIEVRRVNSERALELRRAAAGRSGVYVRPLVTQNDESVFVILPRADFEAWMAGSPLPQSTKIYLSACAPDFLDLPEGEQTLCLLKHGDWSACLELDIKSQQAIRIGDDPFSSEWCEADSPHCKLLEGDPVSRTTQSEYWSRDQEQRVSFLPGGLILVTKLLNRDTKVVRQVSAHRSRNDTLRDRHLRAALDLKSMAAPTESEENNLEDERIELRSALGPDDWANERRKLLICPSGEPCSAKFHDLKESMLGDLESSALIETCAFSD